MDALGGVFLFIFILIFLISNIFFIKGLKRNKITRFKYKLIFSLMCIISVFVTIFFYIIFKSSVLVDLFKLEIDEESYTDRIITVIVVSILNTTANLILLKYYLKKISLKEDTKTSEIELIGIE